MDTYACDHILPVYPCHFYYFILVDSIEYFAGRSSFVDHTTAVGVSENFICFCQPSLQPNNQAGVKIFLDIAHMELRINNKHYPDTNQGAVMTVWHLRFKVGIKPELPTIVGLNLQLSQTFSNNLCQEDQH